MPEPLTKEEIDDWKKTIDNLSQHEMARLRRLAPAGHPIFRMNEPLCKYFEKRFRDLGGMTPAISKALGWER